MLGPRRLVNASNKEVSSAIIRLPDVVLRSSILLFVSSNGFSVSRWNSVGYGCERRSER